MIVVVLVGQIDYARNQMLVLSIGPALASIGLEVIDVDAQWDAGSATIAVRAISEKAAAAKPSGHQF